MIYHPQNLAEKAIPLPIAETAKNLARQFAAQQPTPEKSEQVYLNTLAVCAVNDYLEMMEIPTDLTASNSWSPIMRLSANVADLEVTGYGKLECRPIKSGETRCQIPPEFWEESIGYVVVQIDLQQQEAILLGFSKAVENGELFINKLQSIDDLLEHFEQLSGKSQVNLSQWFEDIFQIGWQSWQGFLGSETLQLAPSFRQLSGIRDLSEAGVKGIKLIDLGIQLENQKVALLVALARTGDRTVGIRVQLHPASSETHLPPNVQLAVLSDPGEILREVRSRSMDNFIQLPHFTGRVGEKFSIQVALERVSMVEDFII